VTAEVSEWRGHVVVCGLHGVGLRTVEQLHLAGVRVVVVDDKPDPLAARLVSEWGVPRLTGSSRSAEVLQSAGLAGASAILCVEDSDLHTLEVALLVNELRPDVRVVSDLANAAVGRAVQGVTGPGSVLDVAELSAPSMVEAALQRDVHEIDLDGTRFVVARVEADRETTLRHGYGDLAPVAVVSADGAEVTICPGRDQPVQAGDSVHVIGTPADLDEYGLPWQRSATTHREPAARRWMRLARNTTVSVFAESDRSLRLVLAALAVLICIATTVLTMGYRKTDGSHMSVLDGIYFSIETIGTIGYGDFSFAEQATWLRAFAVAMMVSGVLLAAIFFALLTNLLVSRRLEESLGRRQLTGMRDHVIVIGLGSVGMRVVEGLRAEGVAAVVIENDENNRYLAQARALNVPILIGDATQRAILEDATLVTARGVAVMTSDDLTNIETGLVVRDQLAGRWQEVPVVLRVFDRVLGRRIERDFGFRHVRSTAALAAPWFVGAALGLDVISTFTVEQQPFLVGRLHVAPTGGLNGLPMSDLSARTRVIAIRRAGAQTLEYPPRRDTRFAADDVAYIVGPYEELITVLRRDALSLHALVETAPLVPLPPSPAPDPVVRGS
jgi:Trk K+ transport system NAD-binding subunit